MARSRFCVCTDAVNPKGESLATQRFREVADAVQAGDRPEQLGARDFGAVRGALEDRGAMKKPPS